MPFVGGAGSFEGRDSDKPNRVSYSEFYHSNVHCQAFRIRNFLSRCFFTLEPSELTFQSSRVDVMITSRSSLASPAREEFFRISPLDDQSHLGRLILLPSNYCSARCRLEHVQDEVVTPMVGSSCWVKVVPLAVVHRDSHFGGVTIVHAIRAAVVLIAPVVLGIVHVRIVVEFLVVSG